MPGTGRLPTTTSGQRQTPSDCQPEGVHRTYGGPLWLSFSSTQRRASSPAASGEALIRPRLSSPLASLDVSDERPLSACTPRLTRGDERCRRQSTQPREPCQACPRAAAQTKGQGTAMASARPPAGGARRCHRLQREVVHRPCTTCGQPRDKGGNQRRLEPPRRQARARAGLCTHPGLPQSLLQRRRTSDVSQFADESHTKTSDHGRGRGRGLGPCRLGRDRGATVWVRPPS
jgi:hypothetical protein